MARKKRPEEPGNHERWMISYADFITLLFAFFVVMYSVSSVNEGKYRVVSHSIVTAFGTPVKSLSPIQIGKLVRAPKSKFQQDILKSPSSIVMSAMNNHRAKSEEGEGGNRQGPGAMKRAAMQIEKALQQLINDGLVEVNQYEDRLEVEIRSSVLFPSGSGQISPSALSILERLAQILGTLTNVVHVEGFTDSIPINTFLYPSNWELSSARSARVVRHLVESGLDPRRLVSVGYAEYQPIASNETAQGRAKNRRVVLVVMADQVGPSAKQEFSLDRLDTEAIDLNEVLAATSLNTEPPVGTVDDSESGPAKFNIDHERLTFGSVAEVELATSVSEELQSIQGELQP